MYQAGGYSDYLYSCRAGMVEKLFTAEFNNLLIKYPVL